MWQYYFYLPTFVRDEPDIMIVHYAADAIQWACLAGLHFIVNNSNAIVLLPSGSTQHFQVAVKAHADSLVPVKSTILREVIGKLNFVWCQEQACDAVEIWNDSVTLVI